MIGSIGLELAERAWIPDSAIRAGIRRLCRRREAGLPGVDARETWIAEHLARMASGPIANVPEAANEQHYEVPADFFTHCLGPRLKYSSCLFEKATTLEEAEIEALEATCDHADLADGRTSSNWAAAGALTLWMAGGIQPRGSPPSRTATDKGPQRPNADEGICPMSDHHGGHERIRNRCPVRSAGLHRDVRTHAQLEHALRAGQIMDA